ncbi:hypothetical protein FBU30_003757 [Linnemannia zychae]|nr:hypothetical protein FBU30_003757 [Linnemannia zychae]
MRFSVILTVLATITASAFAATPPNPNQPSSRKNNQTLNALNKALAIEQLEAEFFKQGLAKFNESDFTNAGLDAEVRDRFVYIGQQDNEHVWTLTSAIKSMNGTSLPACNYSFPMDNVTEFMVVAQAIKNTGVSAYLGSVSGLSGNWSTVVASILTVEARHASYLNEVQGQSGFPYALDTALGPREVVTLASDLVTSCPQNMSIHPFPHLNASLPAADSNSTMVTTSFMGKGNSTTNSTYCQFLYGNNVTVSPRDQCSFPANATGYVFVLVTNDTTPVSLTNNTNVLAGPALLMNGTHPMNETYPTNGTCSNNTMPS